jgi:hypothetical protein
MPAVLSGLYCQMQADAVWKALATRRGGTVLISGRTNRSSR